ncbi:hypothetical protein RRG08_028580 [Elysia crispata]|uniref:Uncharacterized protein n=1 Tax=Elysia crispata TaxID=231223 RepID=A0AAE0YAQ2_9GAST|nr:hypothetical protein RRG08_028580 [Elysia crispata]
MSKIIIVICHVPAALGYLRRTWKQMNVFKKDEEEARQKRGKEESTQKKGWLSSFGIKR